MPLSHDIFDSAGSRVRLCSRVLRVHVVRLQGKKIPLQSFLRDYRLDALGAFRLSMIPRAC